MVTDGTTEIDLDWGDEDFALLVAAALGVETGRSIYQGEEDIAAPPLRNPDDGARLPRTRRSGSP